MLWLLVSLGTNLELNHNLHSLLNSQQCNCTWTEINSPSEMCSATHALHLSGSTTCHWIFRRFWDIDAGVLKDFFHQLRLVTGKRIPFFRDCPLLWAVYYCWWMWIYTLNKFYLFNVQVVKIFHPVIFWPLSFAYSCHVPCQLLKTIMN